MTAGERPAAKSSRAHVVDAITKLTGPLSKINVAKACRKVYGIVRAHRDIRDAVDTQGPEEEEKGGMRKARVSWAEDGTSETGAPQAYTPEVYLDVYMEVYREVYIDVYMKVYRREACKHDPYEEMKQEMRQEGYSQRIWNRRAEERGHIGVTLGE